MREIKFRAWDGEKYVYDEPGFCVLCRYAHEDCEQFTGLCDRHGKEIYEGDIVRACIKGGHTYVGSIIFNADYGQFGVERHKNFKYLAGVKGEILGSSGSSTFYKPYNWRSYKSVEVIGNIHENPELIP